MDLSTIAVWAITGVATYALIWPKQQTAAGLMLVLLAFSLASNSDAAVLLVSSLILIATTIIVLLYSLNIGIAREKTRGFRP